MLLLLEYRTAQPPWESLCRGAGKEAPMDCRTSDPGRAMQIDGAVLFRLPLHTGAAETREVRRPPAVICRRAAHQDSQAGRGLCLPAGAQRAPAPPDLGRETVPSPKTAPSAALRVHKTL